MFAATQTGNQRSPPDYASAGRREKKRKEKRILASGEVQLWLTLTGKVAVNTNSKNVCVV